MEKQSPLYKLAVHYKELTERLSKQELVDSELLLDCLLSRDKIAKIVTTGQDIDPTSISIITAADNQLANLIVTSSQLEEMKGWHTSLNPPKEAWWWHLTPSPTPKTLNFFEQYDWVWSTLNIVVMTITFAILVDIYPRFLSGNGADTTGAFALVVQTVLAMVTAGGVLTKTGGEALKRVFTRLNIPNYLWQETKFGLGLSLLFFLIFFRTVGLPFVAQRYYNKAQLFYDDHQLIPAQQFYKRALALNPDDSSPMEITIHHRLGLLHEQLRELKKARIEYQIAAQNNYSPAYNDLAHLDIQAGSYDKAVYLLLRGLHFINKGDYLSGSEEEKTDLLYDMQKNLGWARLGQERYRDAQAELEIAISLNPDNASAHCLMAQVLEKQADGETTPESLQEWEICRKFADRLTNPDADGWIYQAQQRQLKPTPPIVDENDITPTPAPTVEITASPSSQSEKIYEAGFNLLISTEGEVLLKRENWSDYYPTTVGARLYRGDQIQPDKDAKAIILCNDLTIWSVPGEVISGLNGCPISDKPILVRTTDIITGTLPTTLIETDPLTPYIISPRATQLLDKNIVLRWNPVPNRIAYTITLKGNDFSWQTIITNQSSITYSGETLLTRGKSYFFTVQTSTKQDSISFTVLDEESATTVQKQISLLELSGQHTNKLAVAQIYILNNLTAEAIDLLERLDGEGNNSAVINRTVADLYLKTGLILPAEKNYERALALAQASGNIEVEVKAQIGLVQTSFYQGKYIKATSLLYKAQTKYEMIGYTTEHSSQIELQLEQFKRKAK